MRWRAVTRKSAPNEAGASRPQPREGQSRRATSKSAGVRSVRSVMSGSNPPGVMGSLMPTGKPTEPGRDLTVWIASLLYGLRDHVTKVKRRDDCRPACVKGPELTLLIYEDREFTVSTAVSEGGEQSRRPSDYGNLVS